MENVAKAIGGLVIVVGIIVLVGLLMGYPVKWCWNYTMPYIFGLPTIGFWHGLCLYILGAALFKARLECKCKQEAR